MALSRCLCTTYVCFPMDMDEFRLTNCRSRKSRALSRSWTRRKRSRCMNLRGLRRSCASRRGRRRLRVQWARVVWIRLLDFLSFFRFFFVSYMKSIYHARFLFNRIEKSPDQFYYIEGINCHTQLCYLYYVHRMPGRGPFARECMKNRCREEG